MRALRLALWTAILAAAFCGRLEAQIPGLGQSGSSSESEKADQEPEPIPPSRIAVEAEAVRELLRDLDARLAEETILPRIQADTEQIKIRIRRLRHETESALDGKSWWRVLEDLQRNWKLILGRLNNWLERLDYPIRETDRSLTRVEQKAAVWSRTAAASGDQLGQALANRIRSTVSDLEGMARRLSRRRQDFLDAQSEIIELQDVGQRSLDALGVASRSSLLGFDSPPLWNVWAPAEGRQASPVELQKQRFEAALAYARTESHRLAAQAVLFLAALIPALMLSRRSRRSKIQRTPVLETPISAALLVTLLLTRVFHPQAPRLFYTASGLLLILPLLRVVPKAVGRFQRQIYLLSLLYALGVLFDFAVENTLFGRLLLLGVNLLALLLFGWVARQIRRRGGFEKGWQRAFDGMAWVALGLLTLAILANVVGAVSLGGLILDATLRTLYGGLLLWAGFTVLDQALEAVLESGSARRLQVVQSHGERLASGGSRLLAALSLGLWVFYALSAFRLSGPLWSYLKDVFNEPFHFGELEISLGDVVSFLAVIWLSFIVSKIFRFFLEEEALPRFSLPRGVPATISRLTHYLVLLMGFLFAAGAAGLGLDRITLLAGAFGVGIGFGLQNIVNNLVSGLILLFERPIKIGDLVQLGDLSGRVTSIGFRSSVLRTFEGAEVIVPNGNLISETVVNWTLSDQMRRADVNVGVAYGTDPEKVLKLLTEIAKGHPEVVREPAPFAIFTGFGDSSLNFSLRAWTDDIDGFVVVRSELAVAVNQALKEAGIEIPFPQRDIHVRSGPAPAGSGREES